MPNIKRTFLVVEVRHLTFSLSLFTLVVFSFASLFLLLTLQAGQKLKVTGTVRVFQPRFSFPSFPAIQTHLSPHPGRNPAGVGQIIFFADFSFPSLSLSPPPLPTLSPHT